MVEMGQRVQLGFGEEVVVEKGFGEGGVWDSGRDGEEGVERDGEMSEIAPQEER